MKPHTVEQLRTKAIRLVAHLQRERSCPSAPADAEGRSVLGRPPRAKQAMVQPVRLGEVLAHSCHGRWPPALVGGSRRAQEVDECAVHGKEAPELTGIERYVELVDVGRECLVGERKLIS